MKHIIFGNYGDNTIALIEWAYQQQLESVVVAHVDTGWGAQQWHSRMIQGQQLAQQYRFKTISLSPPLKFADLIAERKNFPSVKYQWCVTFLKALPLLDYLDTIDPSNEATILLGARQADSRARFNLPAFIEESEYYGDRSVWYPLFDATNKQRNDLIHQAGFEILNRRSLECNPCVHFEYNNFDQIDLGTVNCIATLEKQIGKTMFNKSIGEIGNNSSCKKGIENFDLGCGSRYGCGE